MYQERRNGLSNYRFASLDSTLVANAIFTRQGGVSDAPFDSLNIGSTVGDDPHNVSQNMALMLGALGISADHVVTTRQVHGRHTARVGRAQGGTVIPDCDALVTDEPNTFLLMRFADCVPVLLWDPLHTAVGLAHAGWQGTLRQVTAAAVEKMQDEFGTHPQDLRAVIGPSIGPCCMEVGPEVIAQAHDALPDAEQVLSPLSPDGHAQLDLWRANYNQLLRCGVGSIETADYCTCCHQEEFFSHRGSRGNTGRFGAIIGLR